MDRMIHTALNTLKNLSANRSVRAQNMSNLNVPGHRKDLNTNRFFQVRNARNTETAEDYTEMIADLINETGEARVVDLADRFGVTSPTVNSTIRRLVREGLVESKPYRSIFLTEKGRSLADFCKKRHQIVFDFLLSIE